MRRDWLHWKKYCLKCEARKDGGSGGGSAKSAVATASAPSIPARSLASAQPASSPTFARTAPIISDVSPSPFANTTPSFTAKPAATSTSAFGGSGAASAAAPAMNSPVQPPSVTKQVKSEVGAAGIDAAQVSRNQVGDSSSAKIYWRIAGAHIALGTGRKRIAHLFSV